MRWFVFCLAPRRRHRFFLALAHSAYAVGPRAFDLDTLEKLSGGDLKGVAVSSDGRVRAGLTLGNVPLPDATAVYAALPLADGSVLIGTSFNGKVVRVAGDQATVWADTKETAVTSLAAGANGARVRGDDPRREDLQADGHEGRRPRQAPRREPRLGARLGQGEERALRGNGERGEGVPRDPRRRVVRLLHERRAEPRVARRGRRRRGVRGLARQGAPLQDHRPRASVGHLRLPRRGGEVDRPRQGRDDLRARQRVRRAPRGAAPQPRAGARARRAEHVAPPEARQGRALRLRRQASPREADAP